MSQTEGLLDKPDEAWLKQDANDVRAQRSKDRQVFVFTHDDPLPEAACMESVRRRRLARGERHSHVEQLLRPQA